MTDTEKETKIKRHRKRDKDKEICRENGDPERDTDKGRDKETEIKEHTQIRKQR